MAASYLKSLRRKQWSVGLYFLVVVIEFWKIVMLSNLVMFNVYWNSELFYCLKDLYWGQRSQSLYGPSQDGKSQKSLSENVINTIYRTNIFILL